MKLKNCPNCNNCEMKEKTRVTSLIGELLFLIECKCGYGYTMHIENEEKEKI